jgi:hypothetical protein
MRVPFSEATEHNPDDITLLCPLHHREKTAGRLSLETVERHNANPRCKQDGFSWGPFDIGLDFPELTIGNMSFLSTPTILDVLGERILFVNPPETEGGPFRLNALLTDRDGTKVMRIVDNVWTAYVDNWDVQVKGPAITIRKGLADIILKIVVEPPRKIRFERIHMSHRGFNIDCRNTGDVEFIFPNGSSMLSHGTGAIYSDMSIAIQVREDSFALGVGGGSMTIGKMTVGGGASATRIGGGNRHDQIDYLLRRGRWSGYRKA